MLMNRLQQASVTSDSSAKLLSVVRHIKEFGSINELALCKIFGETIWSDGSEYHASAFSFRIDKMTGQCEISKHHQQ